MSDEPETKTYRVNKQLCDFSSNGKYFAIAFQDKLVVKGSQNFATVHSFAFTDAIEASGNWFLNFKSRHGIQHMKPCSDTLTHNTEKAEHFRAEFCKKIENEGLRWENIYNADESGFLWQMLPGAEFEPFSETAASEDAEEKFTALFCANATSNHRIPLMIVGKSPKPKCLKDMRLPLVYINSSKTWMNRALFTKWYTEIFIKSVLEHQKQTCVYGKVILLLDNAPSHPSAHDLNEINNMFEVVCLPPSATTILQPMDQGVISATKKLYKTSMLSELLSTSPEDLTMKWNLSLALNSLSDAWFNLNSTTLNNAWAKLLGNVALEENDEAQSEDDANLSSFCVNFANHVIQHSGRAIEGTADYEEKMSNWVRYEYNCGWCPLTDWEIVQLVTNPSFVPKEEPMVDIWDEEDLNESLESVCQKVAIVPEEIRESIRTLKMFVENDPRCTDDDLQFFRKWEHLTSGEVPFEGVFVNLKCEAIS